MTNRSLWACAAICALVARQASADLVDLTPVSPAVNSVGSVSLSDLQTNAVDGIVVGDKVFTAFSYGQTGDMPVSSAVTVLGYQDLSGNWGITFSGSFLDLPGGPSSSALIRYTVAVHPFQAQLGWKISDAHLSIHAQGLGPNSYAAVNESFIEDAATLNTFVSTIGPGGSQVTDSVLFDPAHTSLHVSKGIVAIAGANSAQLPIITAVDQSFSQVIPEPATAAMSLVTVLALAASRRRSS